MRIYPQQKGFQPLAIYLDSPECIAKMCALLEAMIVTQATAPTVNNPTRNYAKAMLKVLRGYTPN